MPLPVFKTGVFNHSTNPPSFLAGVAGFEPANTAVKVLCLTTWRHPIIKGGTPYWSISTKLYESQKGLCEDRSLIFSTKHFVPDLRLAKYYSQHIRSMVTTNLSNGERPQGFSPPLIWCNTYYTQPFYWPYRTLFTCNFQKAFRNLVTFSSLPIWSSFIHLNDCVFPTRTSNLSYTRISTLHRKMDCLALPTVAILATRITYRLILHRSVYYSINKNCSFATHSNQYNSLRLEVSSSSSFLSIGITPC